VLSPSTYHLATSPNFGIQNAHSGHNYLQYANSSPMDERSIASLSFASTGLPEGLYIPTLLYGTAHQGDLSTGLSVALNASPLSHPPEIEKSTSGDVNAEWMAALDRMPIHDPTRDNFTEPPTIPKTTGFPQPVATANEVPFLKPAVLNPSVPSPRLKYPRFTGQVENTALAPIFMSPLQSAPGLSGPIAYMDGSLDNFTTGTQERYLDFHALLGTLLHSGKHSVS